MKMYYLSSGSYSDRREGPYFLNENDAINAREFLNARLGPWTDSYTGPYETTIHDNFNPATLMGKEDDYIVEVSEYGVERMSFDHNHRDEFYSFDEFGVCDHTKIDGGMYVVIANAWKYTNDELSKIYHDKVAEHKARQAGIQMVYYTIEKEDLLAIIHEACEAGANGERVTGVVQVQEADGYVNYVLIYEGPARQVIFFLMEE